MKKTNQTGQGQAITEYGLSIGLVVVLSIAALTVLGKDVNGIFQGIAPKPPQAIMKNTYIPVLPSEVPDANASTSSGGSNLASQANLDPSTYNQADNYGSLVMTMGANGVTSVLSDKLLVYSQALLDKDQITPEQANLFANLANQGHRIAQIENLLEGGMAAGAEQITFEGKAYSPLDLRTLIGWDDITPRTSNLLDPSLIPYQNPETAAFIDKYKTLLASGALSNPTTQATTMQLATDIGNISEVVESRTARVYFNGDPSTSFESFVASDMTNMKSALICTTGDQMDILNNCKTPKPSAAKNALKPQ